VTIDWDGVDILTFDCYGTLIDWETGIVDALHDAAPEGWPASDQELLERFARHEAEAESGPYLPYRQVLADCIRGIAGDLGVEVTDRAAAGFAGSVGRWPPFPDSPEALARLATRFRLGVITNCDDDLFAGSNEQLGVRFDWVVTAQRAGSYKPSRHNFDVAFEVIGRPHDRIVHVAQSLYHDHVPAKALEMTTVWIDRRGGRGGWGATPPAEARPDATFPTMAAVADAAVPPGRYTLPP
jgi:2-haloacid dehalogenase